MSHALDPADPEIHGGPPKKAATTDSLKVDVEFSRSGAVRYPGTPMDGPDESRSKFLFAYKQDSQQTKHYGLIAEEVAAVYPELVTRTAMGEVQRVKYQELIPMLLNELQREHQEVASLRRELAELRALVGSRPAQ